MLGLAEQRGIKVTNTPDVLTEDVADVAVALVDGVFIGLGVFFLGVPFALPIAVIAAASASGLNAANSAYRRSWARSRRAVILSPPCQEATMQRNRPICQPCQYCCLALYSVGCC